MSSCPPYSVRPPSGVACSPSGPPGRETCSSRWAWRTDRPRRCCAWTASSPWRGRSPPPRPCQTCRPHSGPRNTDFNSICSDFGAGLRIRIRIGFGFNRISGSGSGRAKMTKVEKNLKFHVLKCWMFSLRAEGFFCNLDVLYGGLGIGKF